MASLILGGTYVAIFTITAFLTAEKIIKPKILYNTDKENIYPKKYNISYHDKKSCLDYYVYSQNKNTNHDKIILFFHGKSRNFDEYEKMCIDLNNQEINGTHYKVYFPIIYTKCDQPSEKLFKKVALNSFSHLINDLNYFPENIIIYGFSLGSFSAAVLSNYLTGIKTPIILHGTFRRISDVVTKKYGILSNLLYEFNMEEVLNKDYKHVFFVHGENDKIVPIENGIFLWKIHGKTNRFCILEDKNHHTLPEINKLKIF